MENTDARMYSNLLNRGLLQRVEKCAEKPKTPRKRDHDAFAHHRLERDIADLMLSRSQYFQPHAHVSFLLDDSKKERSIICSIDPLEGIYSGATWKFLIEIPRNYPFEAPRIKAASSMFHPNVDPNTLRVALQLLQSDWSPVLTLRIVVLGLVLLFVEPNLDNTVDIEAASCLTQNPQRFFSRIESIKGSMLPAADIPCRQKRRGGAHILGDASARPENLKRRIHTWQRGDTRGASCLTSDDEEDENRTCLSNVPRQDLENGVTKMHLSSPMHSDATWKEKVCWSEEGAAQRVLVQKLTHCSLSHSNKRRKFS